MKISSIQLKFILLLCTAFLLISCSSTKYGDAQVSETINTDFGSTDLQSIATKLVDDLLTFPPIIHMTSDRRPIIFVDVIKNKTTEHIDMESITDTIQSKLLKSGKFSFVDMSAVKQVQEQLNFQHNSGMVDDQKAIAVGKQIGAEFMLYGNFSSIVKKSGSTKDVYYKFTLKLTNLKTGILEWSGEKEIRKTKARRWIGL